MYITLPDPAGLIQLILDKCLRVTANSVELFFFISFIAKGKK